MFLKEKIGFKFVFALALALSGAFILSIGSDLNFSHITGPLTVILAAFMYSLFSVGSKPLVVRYGALPTAVWAGVIGTVFILPLISSQFFSELRALSLVGWLSVIYLAIISTVIANLIFYSLVATRAVSSLSVQLYLVPIVSLVGGFLLLGESVTWLMVIGAGLLLAAITLATRRSK